MYCSVIGGPALHDRAGVQVEDHGAGDALVVHAVVLVEALVLDGHRGLLHDVGDLGAGHDDAVLAAVELREEHLAGAVVDGGVDRESVAFQGVQRRQVARDRVDGARRDREAGDHGQQQGDDEQLDDEPRAAARLRSLLLALAPAPRDVLRVDAVSRVVSHGSPLYRDGGRAAALSRSRDLHDDNDLRRADGVVSSFSFRPRASRRTRRRLAAGALTRARPRSLQRRARPPSSAARSGRGPPRPRRGRRAGRTSPAC